ncbi:hypothetical protein [Pantoea sp. BAV 3049]|uniref:hypothetical protein n=1 Tax=Pantoea sp. BAV 3049 TaxID=2654188 RepID=UPI001E3643C9|nr:hypothetical protein [Pantoea sp. BAV 3049]
MRVTYDQIQNEVREISLLFGESKEYVPGFFENVRMVLLPLAIYFLFYFICPFTDVFIMNIWLGGGVMSIFFWYFVAKFFYSFSLIFSMLPKGISEKYHVLKIVSGKARIYYVIWNCSIFIVGLISVFTFLNVLSLSILTVLSTIALAIAFNMDISRYQISGLFGAFAAAKEKWNQ